MSKMTVEQYQELAGRTLPKDWAAQLAMSRAVMGLGLSGESGEVADRIKKEVGHGHPHDAQRLKEELGDALWYVAAVCTVYGLDMATVAEANIDKLRRRYPEGFSTEASLNRKE